MGYASEGNQIQPLSDCTLVALPKQILWILGFPITFNEIGKTIKLVEIGSWLNPYESVTKPLGIYV